MNKRILAFLIDFLIAMLLIAIIGSISMINFTSIILSKIYGIVLIVSVFSLYFKDIINGKSVGKRIMKIKVVDFKENTPSTFRLFIRNVTLCIWPIEFLRVLLGKERFGDIIAKTKVVQQL